MTFRIFWLAALCLLAAAPLQAADKTAEQKPAELPQVPGDDIFGFTSPSDTGNPGERSFSLESTSRIGRDGGLYVTPSVKIEFGYAIVDNLWVAISPFVTNYRIRDLPGINDLSRTRFDGLSTELIWRVFTPNRLWPCRQFFGRATLGAA